MVALFFGLHPIHTEAVNSIYNRSEMMVSAFALMALLLAHIGWRRFPLWSAVGGAWLYGLALFTRESAVTIPLWVGGFVWLQFQGMPGTMARRHKAPFVLFALPLLIYLGLRASALAGRIAGAEPPLGVTEVDAGVGRIHISVATVIEYVRMMVWPWPLRISWENFSGAIHPIGALVAIFLVIRGWRLRKSMPQVGLATFLFFLSLLPSTRLFTSSDLLVKWGDWTMLQAAPGLVLVGERVAYFPSIAAALLINSALSANCSPKGRV